MLRRNRKVARGDDDEEAASPSPHKVSLLPTLQQHHKRKARRRKRRFNHDSTKLLNFLGMIICVLLVLIIGHGAFTRKQTSRHPPNPMSQSHRHKKTDDSSSSTNLQRPFNQTIDCPLEPIPGYPFEYNLVEMLEDWPIDDISLDTTSHSSLCVFDWNHDVDREKMERYRTLELPFVIAGDPQVAEAADRWNQPGYLTNMLGADTKYSTDYSTTNHYIYVNQIQKARYKGSNQRLRKGKAQQVDSGNDDYDDQAATNNTKIQMTYPEWLAIAQANEKTASASDPHWYFQFMTCGTYEKGDCKSNANGTTTSRLATLGTELPFLSDPESFYIVEPHEQKGRIQCKFGMAGITSQAHFDTPRNFLVLLGGKRRYVLLHPRNYANLYMFPGNHPSARHSAVNWSTPDLDKHPMFAKAKATEIVLQQGEVLYIPPKWIHSIVSLSISMQCNAWSGSKNQEG